VLLTLGNTHFCVFHFVMEPATDGAEGDVRIGTCGG
jgi:hypothetical protein